MPDPAAASWRPHVPRRSRRLHKSRPAVLVVASAPSGIINSGRAKWLRRGQRARHRGRTIVREEALMKFALLLLAGALVVPAQTPNSVQASGAATINVTPDMATV